MAEEKSADGNLAARVRDLEAQLKAQRATVPTSLIPEHGAGKGDEIAETWSAYDQQRAISDR